MKMRIKAEAEQMYEYCDCKDCLCMFTSQKRTIRRGKYDILHQLTGMSCASVATPCAVGALEVRFEL